MSGLTQHRLSPSLHQARHRQRKQEERLVARDAAYVNAISDLAKQERRKARSVAKAEREARAAILAASQEEGRGVTGRNVRRHGARDSIPADVEQQGKAGPRTKARSGEAGTKHEATEAAPALPALLHAAPDQSTQACAAGTLGADTPYSLHFMLHAEESTVQVTARATVCATDGRASLEIELEERAEIRAVIELEEETAVEGGGKPRKAVLEFEEETAVVSTGCVESVAAEPEAVEEPTILEWDAHLPPCDDPRANATLLPAPPPTVPTQMSELSSRPVVSKSPPRSPPRASSNFRPGLHADLPGSLRAHLPSGFALPTDVQLPGEVHLQSIGAAAAAAAAHVTRRDILDLKRISHPPKLVRCPLRASAPSAPRSPSQHYPAPFIIVHRCVA